VASPSTATSPSDGVIRVELGAQLQALVNANPSGTEFLVAAGTHRNQRVVPKDGNVFVGEPGAVLDGGGSVDHAFVGDADNVTIEGLVVKNYANPAQSGAINGWGSGWKILDNEVRDNAGAGVAVNTGFVVSGNKIHHNDQIGILGRGANGQVINNEIAHNNYRDRYEMGWEAGGTKFMYTTNLRVAGNNVHDNHGIGLWTDHNNYKTLYENNTVRDNYGPGIMHEISYDATIRNNTVTGNAHKFYVGGILIATSSNVTAYGNVLSGNDGGINGIQDNRGSGDRGTFATTGLQVQDNNVSFTVGWNGVRVNSGTNVTQSGTILYEDNDYDLGSDNTPFLWNNSEITIQHWKTLGFDTNGTFK
jgi:parallel beta-helix repeat protein